MVRRLSSLAFVVGLFVLMVPAAAAGGGCHVSPDLPMRSSAKTDVDIARCAFLDTVTYVDPGESVTWVNQDPVPHTVSGALGSWGDEKFLSRGDRVTYKFDEEGVFPYYCALHPAMVGAVVVGDASAGATGSGVSPVDAPAAAPANEPSGGSGSSTAAIAGGSIALGAVLIAFAARVMMRRRAGSASVA